MNKLTTVQKLHSVFRTLILAMLVLLALGVTNWIFYLVMSFAVSIDCVIDIMIKDGE